MHHVVEVINIPLSQPARWGVMPDGSRSSPHAGGAHMILITGSRSTTPNCRFVEERKRQAAAKAASPCCGGEGTQTCRADLEVYHGKSVSRKLRAEAAWGHLIGDAIGASPRARFASPFSGPHQRGGSQRREKILSPRFGSSCGSFDPDRHGRISAAWLAF